MGLGYDRRALFGAFAGLLATGACARAASQAAAANDVPSADGGLWPDAAPPAAFPLAVSPDGRRLVDAAGAPFLIHGDAGWSLIAQLRREDAADYLADRRARGFSTILVNLIEHRFATNAPANIYGDPPFLTPGDFTTPNEAYFAHADWVLARAAEQGLLILLAPAYLGNGGGDEGWYQEVRASGSQAMRDYGRFLGERYGGLNNIMWVHAGDYDPPDRDLVRAVVAGVREADQHALHTVHCGPNTSSSFDYWPDEDWLSLNTLYTSDVYEDSARAYARSPPMPFFLIEGDYENEGYDGTPTTEQELREQAYHAVLAGGVGHVYGANPIWTFSGPGIFDTPLTWREVLGSRGGQSMTHMRNVLSLASWPRLVPDVEETFLTRGAERGRRRAAAAVASDGSAAIVYAPSDRGMELDLTALGGAAAELRWFDPSSGAFVDAPGEGPRRRLRTPGLNDAGFEDWVLLARAPE